MNIKVNNIIISEDFNSINLKNLEISDQIVIINKEYNFLNKEINPINHKVLSNKILDSIYIFNNIISGPNLHYNENDELVDAYMTSTSQYDSAYINVKDKSYKLKKTNYHVYDSVLKKDNSDYDYKMSLNYINYFKEIYKSIFINENETIYYEKNFLNNKFASITIPISDNNFISFCIKHAINVNKLHWDCFKSVFLINKNGDLINMNFHKEDILDFYNFIKNDIKYDRNLKKFDKEMQISNYNIKDYLQDNGAFLKNVIYNFCNVSSFDIAKFYNPIYVNDDLNYNVKIYQNTIRGLSDDVLVLVNGEHINTYNINKMENKDDIFNYIKIAKNIKDFIKKENALVNPYNGNINPDFDKKNNNKIIYKDANAMILRKDRFIHYYYKLLNFWVIADQNEDKCIIDEINERRKVFEILKNQN